MSRPFSRTLRSLDVERRISAVGLSLVGLLMLAWLGWLFASRISVFELTRLGRLEVDRAVYPIESEVDGRVVAVNMTIGHRVEAGELLVGLDTGDLEIALREQQARRRSLDGELAAARDELALREAALEQSRRTSRLALEETAGRHREAEIEARFAGEEAERAARLHGEGQLSRVEMERQQSQAQRLEALTSSLQVAVERQRSQMRGDELEVETELAEMRGGVARLEGQVAVATGAIEQLRHDFEKHSIRAPRAGELGEVKDLTTASLVEVGEQLGTILAAGEIRMVGDFAPASALGRIAVGQRAQARLDGFPWTRYGMLAATVSRVAAEPRDGKLRVELDVERSSTTRVPLQHGLTGTIEVEVERISPAALLLRSLGKVLDGSPLPRSGTDTAAG